MLAEYAVLPYYSGQFRRKFYSTITKIFMFETILIPDYLSCDVTPVSLLRKKKSKQMLTEFICCGQKHTVKPLTTTPIYS